MQVKTLIISAFKLTKLDDFQLNCAKSVHLVASKKSTPLQCPAAFRLDLLFLDVHATDVCIGHVRLFGHGHALHLQRHMFPGKKNEMNQWWLLGIMLVLIRFARSKKSYIVKLCQTPNFLGQNMSRSPFSLSRSHMSSLIINIHVRARVYTHNHTSKPLFSSKSQYQYP